MKMSTSKEYSGDGLCFLRMLLAQLKNWRQFAILFNQLCALSLSLLFQSLEKNVKEYLHVKQVPIPVYNSTQIFPWKSNVAHISHEVHSSKNIFVLYH